MKFLLFTFLLIQAGTACWGGTISDFFQKRFQKSVTLVEGGYVFNAWKEAGVPIYMMANFFNVTNPHRVLRGEKPVLKELGPFVFQEKRENIIEGFSENNETVTYRMKTTFTFMPEYSHGTEEDVITTLNVPYIVMLEKALDLSAFSKFLVREIFANNNERLFIRKTVKELLFGGYYQDSVEAMSDLSGEEFLPNNTFGFFYGKNDTATDLLEIYTGVGNSSLFGQTKSWEGQTELTYWDNEQCNKVTGSDGAVFLPWLNRNITLTIFSPDLCRSIYLTYQEDVRVTGIKGYKFVVPRDVLASPEENPENECYCKGQEYGPCLKTGAMRLAPCRGGIPVVISWPHFYKGDPEYVNQSIGLKPDAFMHETFLILEPYTGLIRRGSKRYQINIELKPNNQFRDMKRIPKMIFPILWMEESKISRFRTASYFRKLIRARQRANAELITEPIEDLSQTEEEEDY